MKSSTSIPRVAGAQGASLGALQKSMLAILCIGSGFLALSPRYVPEGIARITYGLCVTALFLSLSLFARQRSALRRYWELPFAFFVLSAFVLLDNTVPQFAGTYIMHDTPVAGNPLASTMRGSIIIQLLETALGIVLVVGLTKA